MKKNIKITTIVLTALIAFLFTGCFDPIYGVIRNDVKPEKATVNGFVNSIARYNTGTEEYLVTAANGGLRYKKADNQSHGAWATYGGLPFGTVHNDFDSENYEGKQIVKVVADDTHLYLVTVSYNRQYIVNPEIWAGKLTDGWKLEGEWVEITSNLPKESKLEINYLSSNLDRKIPVGNFNVFFTNDVTPGNRYAYLRVGNTEPKYFTLKGTTPLETPELEDFITKDNTLDYIEKGTGEGAKDKNVINSAVFDGTGVKFFNTPVSTVANGNIYYANGSTLNYKIGSNATASKDAGSPIASLAVCSDAILIGCGGTGAPGGIKKMALSDGKPTGLADFTNNAVAQMPTAYTVAVLFNVNPIQKEKDSIIYSALSFAGSGSSGNARYEDVGLWSYYPNRGNWNRE